MKQRNDVKSQTLPLSTNLTSNLGATTEQLRENETKSEPIFCLKNSQNSQNETLKTKKNFTADM